MSKNIVVLSDGTGQVGGKGHDTNIYKLFRMLEDRTNEQIVLYDEGLGTESQKVSGMAFGRGFGKNIQECYKFIFDNYKAGDKIFLFGFSRGAATVRSLASFIHYFGILPTSRPELIREAYRLYANRKESDFSETSQECLDGTKRKQTQSARASRDAMRSRSLGRKVADGTLRAIDKAAYGLSQVGRKDLDDKSREFVRDHPNQWATIEFLGVWDTVPALGFIPIPKFDALINKLPAWNHRFHDFKLHESVLNAYHALSIDDNRVWFFPTIWKECNPKKQKVEQVWFSGSHTDVGGGFWEAGFSDIALEWMVGKALQHGIRLHLGSRRYWNFCIAPDPTDMFHDPRDRWGKIYAHGERNAVWDEDTMCAFGPPRIHASVLDRAEADDEYCPWILRQYPQWDDDCWNTFLASLYKSEMERLYLSWHYRMSKSGLSDPDTLEEWMARSSNTYDEWLRRSNLAFRDYKGKKILVEQDQPIFINGSPLRDYDYANPPKIKEMEDDPLQQLCENLWIRGLKRQPKPGRLARLLGRKTEPDAYRFVYDTDRWRLRASSKTKNPAGIDQKSPVDSSRE